MQAKNNMNSTLYDQNLSMDIIKTPDTILMTKSDQPSIATPTTKTMEDIDIINDGQHHQLDDPLSNPTRK